MMGIRGMAADTVHLKNDLMTDMTYESVIEGFHVSFWAHPMRTVGHECPLTGELRCSRVDPVLEFRYLTDRSSGPIPSQEFQALSFSG